MRPVYRGRLPYVYPTFLGKVQKTCLPRHVAHRPAQPGTRTSIRPPCILSGFPRRSRRCLVAPAGCPGNARARVPAHRCTRKPGFTPPAAHEDAWPPAYDSRQRLLRALFWHMVDAGTSSSVSETAAPDWQRIRALPSSVPHEEERLRQQGIVLRGGAIVRTDRPFFQRATAKTFSRSTTGWTGTGIFPLRGFLSGAYR